MALIKCPECKKKISDTAGNCPKCGYQLTPAKIEALRREEKITQKRGAVGCLSIIVILILVTIFSLSNLDQKEVSPTPEETIHDEKPWSTKFEDRQIEQYEALLADCSWERITGKFSPDGSNDTTIAEISFDKKSARYYGDGLIEFWSYKNFSEEEINNLSSVGFTHRSVLSHHLVDLSKRIEIVDHITTYSERNMKGKVIESNSEPQTIELSQESRFISQTVLDYCLNYR